MIIVHFIISVLATVSFAVLFNAPKKEVIYCGFTGAIAWTVYYALTGKEMNIILATLIAAFALTVFARCLAVIRKNPVTVYLLPGIFPLVPGAGIYYTAYYLFVGNNEMSGVKGLETLELAGAIVFGIIFGFGIPQKLFHKLSVQKKNDLNEEN